MTLTSYMVCKKLILWYLGLVRLNSRVIGCQQIWQANSLGNLTTLTYHGPQKRHDF